MTNKWILSCLLLAVAGVGGVDAHLQVDGVDGHLRVGGVDGHLHFRRNLNQI